VWRLCVLPPAAPIGASILAAVLLSTPAFGQAPAANTGLRLTLDDAANDVARSGQKKAPPRRARDRAGQVPTFGTPPAAGAGATGFVSTNTSRRKARTRGKTPGAIPRAGTSLAPPLLLSQPDAAEPRAKPSTDPSSASAGAGKNAAPVPAPGGALVAGPTGTLAPPRRRRVPLEDDPFDAVGIRAGGFVLRPAIELTAGYDSNPARLNVPRGSSQFGVAPELLMRSDWSSHSLEANLRGSYNTYPSVPLADRPNLDARVIGRVDVTRDTRVNLETRYLLSTDYPGSPNLPADIAKLPIFTTVGATAGIAQRFNRLDVSLKGSVDRTEFQDSRLTDGTRSNNLDRNYDQYGVALRGSYELTPGVKPFVELAADSRVHDLAFDRNGEQRDSNGLTPRIGTTFEITRKLTGEISAGYLTRVYKDPLLPDLRGLVADAALVWSASALTNVKLIARSTAEESVVPGVSGAFRRDTGLELNHAFRRWLIATAKVDFGSDEYVGSTRLDHRYLGSVGLVYKLDRTMQIKGELRQERLRSNLPGSDYTANIVLVGLRLQR